MEIIITTGGQGRCVYDEAIDLTSLGRIAIQRASHVEPDADGHWADTDEGGTRILVDIGDAFPFTTARHGWFFVRRPATQREQRRNRCFFSVRQRPEQPLRPMERIAKPCMT